jgi:hypothetical protein
VKAVYIAHPLGQGPDRDENIKRAAKWVGWAGRQRVCPMASWITLASVWAETEDNRKTGLEIDFAQIDRCDELWICGSRISPGMETEIKYAKTRGIPVVDKREVEVDGPRRAT